MKQSTVYIVSGAAATIACAASFGAGLIAQQSLEGGVFESRPGGTQVEVLFDGGSRGVGVDVGVITFPPGNNSGDHEHPQTEIFYVLDGALEHVVNGESIILEPGMLGHVQPPDLVNHITAPNGSPTRAVVIWSPSGGAERIASRWNRLR